MIFSWRIRGTKSFFPLENGDRCDMIDGEVLSMEEQKHEERTEEQVKEVYTPRPVWQVWAARVGLVIMIICVILYYWHIASGGMR